MKQLKNLCGKTKAIKKNQMEIILQKNIVTDRENWVASVVEWKRQRIDSVNLRSSE